LNKFINTVKLYIRITRPITLYCDCVLPLGSHIVWWRHCSKELRSTLFIDTLNMLKETFKHFSFVFNTSSNFFDLHIVNVSVSDEGIYYCAERERSRVVFIYVQLWLTIHFHVDMWTTDLLSIILFNCNIHALLKISLMLNSMLK